MPNKFNFYYFNMSDLTPSDRIEAILSGEDLAPANRVEELLVTIVQSIPTKVSDLENDEGFITVGDIPAPEAAGGHLELVASGEVTGSAANILTISGLNLDLHNIYKIFAKVKVASGGNAIVGYRLNNDSNAGNYRNTRTQSGGGSLASASLSSNNLGASLTANEVHHYEFTFGKQAGQSTRGEVAMKNYESIGGIYTRQWGVGHLPTANITSFSLEDVSGGNYLGIGTKVAIYKYKDL